MENNINTEFHKLADRGKEITDFRKLNKQYSNLSAHRIEILILLKKIKEDFKNLK